MLPRRRKIEIALLALTLLSATCGRSGISDDEATSPKPGADAEPDVGDAGIFSCQDLDDCAPFGLGRPCETLEGCGCGTFHTCHQSRCVSYSVECPDAGSAGCNTAADCEGANGVALGCFDVEARSCVDGSCVLECRANGRTCWLVAGPSPQESCFDCGDGARNCVNQCASANVRVEYEVEQTNCEVWPSSGRPVLGSALISTDQRGPSCSYWLAHSEDGRALGAYHLLESFEFLADFPELGGTCTGTMLPTGLERILFGCPACYLRLVRTR